MFEFLFKTPFILNSIEIIELKFAKLFEKPPFERMMTFLMDDDWKNVRSIVSVSFTSGKLKEV